MLKREGRIRRLLRSKAVSGAITGACTFIVAVLAGVRYLNQPNDRWLTVPSMAVAGILFFFTLAKAWSDWVDEKDAVSPDPLDCALHTLAAILENDEPGDPELRLCVYVREDKMMRQVTNYVGVERRGKDRLFSTKLGIVGKVFRCQTPKIAISNLPVGMELRDFLVNEFGYDHDDAARCRSDRKSWAAAPIGTTMNIIAVVYCDSSVRGFFNNRRTFRRKALDSAILGIARYLGPR